MKIAETETIQNQLNPDFVTSFTVAYYFERQQHVKFEMIDIDDSKGGGDRIGEIECTMGQLMGAKRQIYTADLMHNGAKNRG